MTFDVPTFCRVEYWNAERAEWSTGHSGMNFMDPARYVQKLGERGVVARLIEVDTENTLYGEGADLL